MAIELHRCDGLMGTENISIQKIQGKWYWVFWGKKNQCHGIKYCPYCGKELKENDEN